MKRGTNLILGFLLVSGVGYATHENGITDNDPEGVADEATKTLKIFKLNI
ncbi:hypothetical protein HYX00_04890 [Candidatus Woesearchaeota archaeon]|nr:hypothetical protein [Candidatus Woesearchaeota archaeon]